MRPASTNCNRPRPTPPAKGCNGECESCITICGAGVARHFHRLTQALRQEAAILSQDPTHLYAETPAGVIEAQRRGRDLRLMCRGRSERDLQHLQQRAAGLIDLLQAG